MSKVGNNPCDPVDVAYRVNVYYGRKKHLSGKELIELNSKTVEIGKKVLQGSVCKKMTMQQAIDHVEIARTGHKGAKLFQRIAPSKNIQKKVLALSEKKKGLEDGKTVEVQTKETPQSAVSAVKSSASIIEHPMVVVENKALVWPESLAEKVELLKTLENERLDDPQVDKFLKERVLGIGKFKFSLENSPYIRKKVLETIRKRIGKATQNRSNPL